MKTSARLRGPVINTELPGPRSQELMAISEQYEPKASSEQVPIVWKHAEGVWATDMDDNTFSGLHQRCARCKRRTQPPAPRASYARTGSEGRQHL